MGSVARVIGTAVALATVVSLYLFMSISCIAILTTIISNLSPFWYSAAQWVGGLCLVAISIGVAWSTLKELQA